MKKSYVLPAFLILFMRVVSAQLFTDPVYGVNKGINQIILFIEAFLGPIFFVLLGGDGGLLFERILFLFLIFSVVYVVISQVDLFKGNDKKVIRWVLVIAVSLLSTRFLVESNIIQAMILPYSAFGIAVSSIIPFILYFTFVHKGFPGSGNSIIRKIMWGMFIVVFIGLWNSRYEDLGAFSWIYFWTAVLALGMLLSDRPIQRYFRKLEQDEISEGLKDKRIAYHRKRLKELDEEEEFYSDSAYQKARRKILKDLEKAHKSKF